MSVPTDLVLQVLAHYGYEGSDVQVVDGTVFALRAHEAVGMSAPILAYEIVPTESLTAISEWLGL